MGVLDILLDTGGDYKISDTGDIILTQSVRQAIKIRLKWFLGEWRLGPLLGLDYWGTDPGEEPEPGEGQAGDPR